MRYLLIFLAVLILVWRWRSARAVAQSPPPQRPPVAGSAVNMVACAQCGVHIPAGDAVTGARGTSYCSTAHRQQRES